MDEKQEFVVDFECGKAAEGDAEGDVDEDAVSMSASWKSELEWQKLAKNTGDTTVWKEGEAKTEDVQSDEVKNEDVKGVDLSRADTVVVSTCFVRRWGMGGGGVGW